MLDRVREEHYSVQPFQNEVGVVKIGSPETRFQEEAVANVHTGERVNQGSRKIKQERGMMGRSQKKSTPMMTSAERMDIYRCMFRLNRAFAVIVQHLKTLQETGLFRSKASKLFPAFAQELQAEFNQEFLENMHQFELDDWGRYGKARDKYEKHLRDPDDVFIQAEERKKQLAKQRNKHLREPKRKKS